MAKENKEVCSGQEMSTHALEVSTHEDSIQKSGQKVSTHGVEKSTHEDSTETENEVPTHGF